MISGKLKADITVAITAAREMARYGANPGSGDDAAVKSVTADMRLICGMPQWAIPYRWRPRRMDHWAIIRTAPTPQGTPTMSQRFAGAVLVLRTAAASVAP